MSYPICFLVLCFAFQMSAADSSLHPLGKSIEPGEIHFQLREAASPGESIGVECIYRPYRQRDVKRVRSLNLLRGWLGSGSRDLIREQRDEFHSARWQFQTTSSEIVFNASLRDPDREFSAYQLDRVRLVGNRIGTIEFQRWFELPPKLDAGFGMNCDASTLRGFLRPSALVAQPLRGSPPLWPTLRTVDVTFVSVDVPVVRLFDATAKHHWDGWRQTTPQFWPGGRTIVLRHLEKPTVWLEFEYDAFPRGDEPASIQPTPPNGVMPGVQLEVYWPAGETLDFPETRFERDVGIVAMPLAKTPNRLRERVAQSIRRRPGWEPSSISAKEWDEFQENAPNSDQVMKIEMAASGDGKSSLRITRSKGFTEPWLCIFGAPFDDDRRIIISSLLLKPERWTGPLPE